MDRPPLVFISPLAFTLITSIGALFGAMVAVATPPEVDGVVAMIGIAPVLAVLLFQAGWMLQTYAFLRRLRNVTDEAPSLGAIFFGFLVASAVILAIEFGFTDHARPHDGSPGDTVMLIPTMLCFLALAVLTAREITTAHQPKPGHIKRPVVYFLALAYLVPIGIWFIHPLLKRIAERASV